MAMVTKILVTIYPQILAFLVFFIFLDFLEEFLDCLWMTILDAPLEDCLNPNFVPTWSNLHLIPCTFQGVAHAQSHTFVHKPVWSLWARTGSHGGIWWIHLSRRGAHGPAEGDAKILSRKSKKVAYPPPVRWRRMVIQRWCQNSIEEIQKKTKKNKKSKIWR